MRERRLITVPYGTAREGAGLHHDEMVSAQADEAALTKLSGRTHIEKPYVSETHDCFHFWNGIPWSLHFLSVPDGKKTKQKKGQPPRHSSLRFATPPLTE